ncbi:vacuolar protein sorting/secretion protein [Babesia caballi]|uniref:Vacuolar protein sorting/secretion protein n=1 Tax=Babesia caballi TaxID=5871 RepID=A0AAV4LLQ9_BABCB|nr:vacuolar protein sorting/secretion protein [Babesia caballi]
MSLVDRVSADARSEFLSSVANVVASIERLRSRGITGADFGGTESQESPGGLVPLHVREEQAHLDSEGCIRRFISKGNELHLKCTLDVKDLLSHLFRGDELLELGFASIQTISSHAPRRSPRTTDGHTAGQHYDIFLLRPALTDAHQLKSALHLDRSECFVICLPAVSDMFPEVLQGVMGKGYTVARGIRGQSGNRVIHLFGCNVHMAPVESCALSMFLSRSFESFYGEGDPMASWFFARALEYLESRIFDGAIPMVSCLGNLARFSAEILLKGRRDCAADLIILGKEQSHAPSDMPFLTRELRKNDRVMRRGCEKSNDSATASSSCLGETLLKERMGLLRQSSLVDEAVLIDRKVDLVTPMCLNFTYEGLLDNVFGIDRGKVHLPPGVVEGSAGAAPGILEQYRSNAAAGRGHNSSHKVAGTTELSLGSSLYREIRWLNYSEVGKYLHQRALQVHKGYERGELSTLGEMDAFVKKFKSLQQEHSELSVHVNLMSWLSSLVNGDVTQLQQQLEDSILQSSSDLKLEDSKLASITAKLFNKPCDPSVALFLDLIFWNVDVQQVYRLLVLLSQTRDGLKMTDLQSIKKAIVDQYGFGQMLVMHELEQRGLLRVNESPDGLRWSRLCKKLNLLVDRDTGAADYSVIFGGYAPISIRLFQLIVLSRGISAVQSELRLLNCAVTVLRQRSLVPVESRGSGSHKLLGFLGGVTLGEIAAVAALNQKRAEQTLLLATNVIDLRSMLNVES